MKKGFTLIELILVITMLGILTVTALPHFTSVATNAEIAVRDAVVGAIRSGIAFQRASDMTVNGAPGNYPPTLDNANAGNCASTNPCFSGDVYPAVNGTQEILSQGVTDSSWAKVNDTTYTFNDGSQIYTLTYNNTTGTFQ